MPLDRDREHFQFTQFEGVYFWMKDRDNQILCKVSHEALRDRCARDGENASLPDTFVRHRKHIEILAGEKYDRGYRTNDLIIVLSSELSPVAV